MIPRLISLLALFALVSPAQLTSDQRLADFRNMADLYARRYAAIESRTPNRDNSCSTSPAGFAPLKRKP